MQKEAHPFLEGRLSYLRSVELSDIGHITRWVNDPETTYTMFYGQLPKNTEQVREFVVSQVNSPQHVVFLACDRKTGKPIGLTGLYDIHTTAHSAKFNILIGEKKFRGRGYGTEIAELLLFYGFDRLNLHRIYLGVTSENKMAIHAYQNAGYVLEGTLKDDIYRNSRYYDTIRMAVLREDYYERLYKKAKRKLKV